MRLVIETATAALSVALLDGDAVVAEHHEIVGRGHAERLVPLIASLSDGGRADEVLVDCGPGSFTGVRVGLAAARGLGLAWGVPVYGCSAMDLIAAQAAHGSDAPGRFAVALTGGHGELFVQRFAGRPPVPEGPLESLPPEAAAARLGASRVYGSGADALIAAQGHGDAIICWPRATDAALLAAGRDRLAPAPIYGRAPDAKLPA